MSRHRVMPVDGLQGRRENVPYGRGSEDWAGVSAEKNVEWMPALFLELRAGAWDEASRRARLTGRTVEAVMVRSPADEGVCFGVGGGFLADMDGNGDDVDAVAPLV